MIDADLKTPDGKIEWSDTTAPPLVEPSKEKAGFFKTAGLGILRETDVRPVINLIDKSFNAPNYLNDEIPEGWKSSDWENLRDIPLKNVAQVLRGTSPKEVADIKAEIFQRMEEDEQYENGNALGALVGSIIGGAASFSSLIPIVGQIKYASVTKGFYNNVVRQFSGLAGQAALRNALIVQDSATKNMDDWAINTLSEVGFGSAVFGIMGAKAAGRVGLGKQLMKEKWDGLDFISMASKEGEFTGYKVQLSDGVIRESQNAMKVDSVQKLLDEGIAKYGENFIFKKMFSASPVVRGLTSASLAVRKFTNSIFSHNIVTGGIERGTQQLPDAESLARYWTNQGYKVEEEIGTIWAEGIGMTGPLKDARAKFQKGEIMQRSEFEEALFDPMFNGGQIVDPNVPQHMIPAIKKAAEITRKHYDLIYDEMVRMKILDPNVTSVHDLSYINRIYNKMKMQDLGPTQWTADLFPALMKQQQQIKSYLKPLNDASEYTLSLKKSREELRSKKNLTSISDLEAHHNIKKEENNLTKQIKQSLANEKKVKSELQSAIDKQEIDSALIEGAPRFTPKELEELKAIRAPYVQGKNEIVKTIKEQRKAIKALEKESKLYRSKRNKNKKKFEQHEPQNKKEIEFEREILEQKMELSKRKDNLKKFESEHTFELQNKLHDGKIKSEFVTEKEIGGRMIPKLQSLKPNRWLWTPVKGTDQEVANHLQDVLRTSYDNILQESPDQTIARMGKSVMGGGSNPMKSRVFQFSTEILKPYLETNVTTLMKNHTNYMGKFLGMEEVMRRDFAGASTKEGLEGILTDLHNEFKAEKAKLFQGTKTKERDKASRKLEEQYAKDRDFISTAYSIYWGDYNPGMAGGRTGENINRSLRALKNYNVSTMLGALPFLQLGEPFANFMRHSFGPIIEDTLMPYLKSSSFRKMAKSEARDAGFGMNVTLNAHQNQLWGNGNFYQPQTGIERVTESLAKWSGNVTGSNLLADFNQVTAAEMSKSSLIRTLIKQSEGGKLTIKEFEKLGLLRIDDEYAQRIVNQVKKYGKPELEDGITAWSANTPDWDDFKAAQTFLIAVNKEVSSVILTPNMLDIPFAFRNPFISAMTQFMNYGFASTNSFLIPLLQRPDADKMISVLGMMMVGSMVGPMRQLAAGQEVDLSPGTLITEGVINSGVLGIFGDTAMRINSAFDLPYLSSYRASRYRNKDALDLLGGPSGGTINSFQKVSNMFMSGQINEAGMRRARGLIPLASTWWLRYAGNKFIEALGLPKTAGDAKRWTD